VRPAEILRAIESLYLDRLRPYGRILRKRIAERAAESGTPELGSVEDGELRVACEAIPWLRVADSEGAEWMATLVGQPESFVDVHSPEDVYPPQLWIDAAVYFASLQGEEALLPGGRYMCARVLADRKLCFLEGYSLGEVAHIVQLAISHKKLLGYSDGALVPYARSQSMLKEKHAECQRPCLSSSGAKVPVVATWETFREHLQQLVEEASDADQKIPLSNLKRLFRTRFGVELSETALGHAKLSELLQDPRIGDLCEVKLQPAGHVLLPRCRPRRRNLISLVEGLRLEDETAPPPPQRHPIMEAPGAQPETRRRRPPALCIDETMAAPGGSDDCPWQVSCDSAGSLPTTLSTTPLGLIFPPTPSPSAAYAMALPRLLGSLGRGGPPGLEVSRKEGLGELPSAEDGGSTSSDLSERAGMAQYVLAARPLTPSTLDSLGFSVQNTFIHAALPPPTPMKVVSRLRATSLPRTAR